MESCLLNPQRSIWTNSNVLQPHQLSGNLPNDDEYYLPHQGRSRLAVSIHGWYCHPCYELFSLFSLTNDWLLVGLACTTCTGVSSEPACMTTSTYLWRTTPYDVPWRVMTCTDTPLWRAPLHHSYDSRPVTVRWHRDLLVGYKATLLRGMSLECS